MYKHYVVHPEVATLPAQAACAGHKQGKFAEMEEAIWEKAYRAGRNFSEDNLVKIAQEVGLDVERFKADMKGECVERVRQDQAELSRVGTRGTPAFYINGRYLSGAQPIQNFKLIIDEELKKANERISQGTSVEQYYDQWVMQKGLKQLE